MRLVLFIFFVVYAAHCFAQDFSHTPNWGYNYTSRFTRSETAFSLEEALSRPKSIRQLFVWPIDAEEARRIPELVNLERIIFGYTDMDYFCPAFPFPVEFCRLPNLQSISIIQATTVPDSIVNIQSLRTLYIPTSFELPEAISLLPNLEVFCGKLPAKPWPGNFPALKVLLNWPPVPSEEILSIPSLESIYVNVKVDSLGFLHPDTLLKSLTVFYRLKHLSVGATLPMREDQMPVLFGYLDKVRPREFEINIETTASAGRIQSSPSTLLASISELSLFWQSALTHVLPAQFDSLKVLTCNIEAIGLPPGYPTNARQNIVCIQPAKLFESCGKLERLVMHMNYNYQLTVDTAWIQALARSSCTADTLTITAGSCYDYRNPSFCYRNQHNDEAVSRCEGVINELIATPKKIRSLTLTGFEYSEVSTLTQNLARHPELVSIYVDAKVLDGKPFPLESLLPEQRLNWTLLRNDASTQNSWWIGKTSTVFWVLQSGDFPYFNETSSYESKTQRYNYVMTACPMRPAIGEQLPFSFRLYSHSHQFEHPEIFAESEYGGYCPLCELNWIEWDYNNRFLRLADVRDDSLWKKYSLSNKNEARSPYYQSDDMQVMTWYDSFHQQSMRYESNGRTSTEVRWTVDGRVSYVLLDAINHNNPDAQYQSYTEASWDTAARLLWMRLYVDGKIAELRFDTSGHCTMEGWVDYDMKPYGVWYAFDASGIVSQVSAPPAVKAPPLKVPRLGLGERLKKRRFSTQN